MKKTSGFTLIEVGIVSVLMGALASGALMLVADYLRGQTAQSAGNALSVINNAVTSYEQKYITNLANNTAIPISGYANVANIYAPTTTELFHLGFLTSAPTVSLYGVSISTTMVNGIPTGLTWLTTPFTGSGGAPDQALAGLAMLAAGGNAAISTVASPSIVEGQDGWTATNPIANTPAVLAMRNGAGAGGYVRLDGSTPMEGSESFAGYNLTNVGSLGAVSVTASGAVSATTLTATGTGNSVFFGSSALYSDGTNSVIRSNGGALYVQDFAGNNKTIVAGQLVTPAGNGVQVGSSYLYGDSANTALRQSGALYVQNQSGSAYANANVAYLSLNGTATAGAGCSPNGLLGQDGSGNLLYCANGVWTAPGGGGTNTYVSQDVTSGGVYYPVSGTKRLDGYVFVQWTGSNAGVAEFVVRDTSGNIQNYFFAGDYGWNDGGSGSQWYLPVSIPLASNTGSVQLVQIDGTNTLTWHVASYEH